MMDCGLTCGFRVYSHSPFGVLFTFVESSLRSRVNDHIRPYIRNEALYLYFKYIHNESVQHFSTKNDVIDSHLVCRLQIQLYESIFHTSIRSSCNLMAAIFQTFEDSPPKKAARSCHQNPHLQLCPSPVRE